MKKGLREQTLILLFKTFRNNLRPDTPYSDNLKSYKITKEDLKKSFFYEKNNGWLTLYFSINGIF